MTDRFLWPAPWPCLDGVSGRDFAAAKRIVDHWTYNLQDCGREFREAQNRRMGRKWVTTGEFSIGTTSGLGPSSMLPSVPGQESDGS